MCSTLSILKETLSLPLIKRDNPLYQFNKICLEFNNLSQSVHDNDSAVQSGINLVSITTQFDFVKIGLEFRLR